VCFHTYASHSLCNYKIFLQVNSFVGLCLGTGGGLFTSTSPELRRVVPDDVGKRKLVKVVYVVLEAQYQSSLTTAVKRINASREEVRRRSASSMAHMVHIGDRSYLDMMMMMMR
jgi:hypothetical protein